LNNSDCTFTSQCTVSTPSSQKSIEYKGESGISTAVAQCNLTNGAKFQYDDITSHIEINGWMWFPTAKLMLQWGKVNSPGSSASFRINFPRAFPNNALHIVTGFQHNAAYPNAAMGGVAFARLGAAGVDCMVRADIGGTNINPFNVDTVHYMVLGF
jgi:hypothetical protein